MSIQLKTTSPDILAHFSPLQRTSLMRWLQNSAQTRAGYHRAFLNCLQWLNPDIPLTRRHKIAYMLLNEFGLEIIQKKSYASLIKAVESRLQETEAV